jgi:hypothetical protein
MYSGDWNGKYYESKIAKGKYSFILFRIYVDEKEIHITNEQREKLQALKAKLDIPEKIITTRAYILESLQLATEQELLNEITRRGIKLIPPEPEIDLQNIPEINRFAALELV